MSMFEVGAAQQKFRDTRNMLAVLLNDLADVALIRGEMILNGRAEEGLREPQKEPLADVLRRRAERVAARTPFRVAVVGEFSRGKSTLINALLGKAILATDFRPNTAARTVLKYGEPERFRVTYMGGTGRKPLAVESEDLGNDLPRFTSDTTVDSDYDYSVLRGDRKSLAELIEQVEVWCVSDFLKAKEMEIIDTPGLGSVFQAHKEVTHKIIPHVDATLFLVQADPGPGESEIEFLRFVREYVTQIFFVLTKADMARSDTELESMKKFVRAVVEAKAEVQVENLYPVSALRALEGHLDESGFAQFLPALETFLVRSSGVARLQVPLHLARTHWARMSAAAERDVQALDQDLGFLQAELDRLQGEKQRIQADRDNLLQYVDHRIEDLVELTTDGMEDRLPMIIQRDVEASVDEMGVRQLRKAPDHLQLVMKESVVSWLGPKEERFRSSTEQLQHRIEGDLRSILESIESNERAVEYGVHIDVTTPQIRGGLWGGVGESLLRGGTTLSAGLGAAFVVIIASTAATAGFALVPVFLGLLGAIGQMFAFPGRARAQMKKKLSEPLPDSDRNVYQALVEGFEQEGQQVVGIRTGFESELRNWGGQLKRNISETITNNLDSRLDQLGRQIEEKKGGQQNREQELEKYTGQKAKLSDIGSRLDLVSTAVVELSVGGPRGQAA